MLGLFTPDRRSKKERHADRVRSEVTPRVRGQVLRRDGYQCRYCQAALSRKARKLRFGRGWRNGHEIDHYKPVALWGDSSLDNLRAACQPCNRVKSARSPAAWSRWMVLHPHALWLHRRGYDSRAVARIGAPALAAGLVVLWFVARQAAQVVSQAGWPVTIAATALVGFTAWEGVRSLRRWQRRQARRARAQMQDAVVWLTVAAVTVAAWKVWG